MNLIIQTSENKESNIEIKMYSNITNLIILNHMSKNEGKEET